MNNTDSISLFLTQLYIYEQRYHAKLHFINWVKKIEAGK